MLKFKNVIMCEYAAQDVRNKYILAGVYAGDIVVDKFPALMTFHMYIESFAPEARDYGIVISVLLDDVVVASANIEAHVKEDEVNVLLVQGLYLNILNAATLEIIAVVNSDSPISLFKKRILMGSNSNLHLARQPA